MTQLMHDPSPWGALEGLANSQAGSDTMLGWIEVSRAGGALFELVLVEQGAYPWKLFTLLDTQAEAQAEVITEDWRTCKNMFDDYSKQHLEKYNERLLDAQSIAELVAAAAIIEDNTKSIERSHASAKRTAGVMEQTHTSRICDADAERVAKRFRSLGSRWHGRIREAPPPPEIQELPTRPPAP